MRQPARYQKQILNALWSPETFRVLFVGLLAWCLSALALVTASAYGFDALPASTLRATALNDYSVDIPAADWAENDAMLAYWLDGHLSIT